MSKSEIIPIDKDYPQVALSLNDALEENLRGLYRFALRLSGSPDRAEDLTQETATRAWERRDANVRNWRAWLFQTLYHKFLSDQRRSKRWREEGTDDSVLVEAGVSLDPLPALIASGDVRCPLEALSENLRTVIWLSDAEDFRLREIATILDCPIGTVASRLARARSELRKTLSAYETRNVKKS
jgi:RNA polymerase sigma-70 factor (ECF subfamily)